MLFKGFLFWHGTCLADCNGAKKRGDVRWGKRWI